MRLVGSLYAFLQDRSLLSNFGKCRDIVIEEPREVTPTVLKEYTGLEAIKLAPKKWDMAGISQLALVAFFGGSSFLLSQGIEIRPNLTVILALAAADALLLGGTCLAHISCFLPPHRRCILIHEAGHLVTDNCENFNVSTPEIHRGRTNEHAEYIQNHFKVCNQGTNSQLKANLVEEIWNCFGVNENDEANENDD